MMPKSPVMLSVATLAVVMGLLPPVGRAQDAGCPIKLLTGETSYGKRYDMVDSAANDLFLSPDGKRLAYWAWKFATNDSTGKMFVVVNGVPGHLYDYVNYGNPHAGAQPPGAIIFSPDSRHLAYRALHGKQWLVVQDGKEGKLYEQSLDDMYQGHYGEDVIDDIVFSPDSRHLAYRARRNNKWRAVRDGKEGQTYDWIADNDLHFSANSKRLAYRARRGGKELIVLHEGARVLETRFDPKTRPSQQPTQAKLATDSDPTKPSPAWQTVQRGDKQVVVWNGRQGKPYEGVFGVVLSPGSRHLAYWAKRAGQWIIVVDGVEGNSYLDGPGPKPFHDPSDFDSPPPTHHLSPLIFDSPHSLHTLALRTDGCIIRVQVQIVHEPDGKSLP